MRTKQTKKAIPIQEQWYSKDGCIFWHFSALTETAINIFKNVDWLVLKNATSTDEKNGISWFYRNTKTDAKGNFAKLLQISFRARWLLQLPQTAVSTVSSLCRLNKKQKDPQAVPCICVVWYGLHFPHCRGNISWPRAYLGQSPRQRRCCQEPVTGTEEMQWRTALLLGAAQDLPIIMQQWFGLAPLCAPVSRTHSIAAAEETAWLQVKSKDRSCKGRIQKWAVRSQEEKAKQGEVHGRAK